MIFVSKAICRSTKICRINKALYHYWKDSNETSLSKGVFTLEKFTNLEAYRRTINIYKSNSIAQKTIRGRYCEACSYFLRIYYSDVTFKKDYYYSVVKQYRENFKYFLKYYPQKKFDILINFAVFVCPKVILRIKNILKQKICTDEY